MKITNHSMAMPNHAHPAIPPFAHGSLGQAGLVSQFLGGQAGLGSQFLGGQAGLVGHAVGHGCPS